MTRNPVATGERIKKGRGEGWNGGEGLSAAIVPELTVRYTLSRASASWERRRVEWAPFSSYQRVKSALSSRETAKGVARTGHGCLSSRGPGAVLTRPGLTRVGARYHGRSSSDRVETVYKHALCEGWVMEFRGCKRLESRDRSSVGSLDDFCFW